MPVLGGDLGKPVLAGEGDEQQAGTASFVGDVDCMSTQGNPTLLAPDSLGCVCSLGHSLHTAKLGLALQLAFSLPQKCYVFFLPLAFCLCRSKRGN